MPKQMKVVTEFGTSEVVEVLDPGIGPRRYFGRRDGQIVTKGYPSVDAVRTELEMQAAKASVANSKWLAPNGLVAIAPGSIFLYPLGRVLLLALTFGRYPKGKHNMVFVTFFPWLLVLIALSVLALIHG